MTVQKPSTEKEKERILLVEDSPSLSVVYKGYLEKLGCEVVTVADGRSAMNELQRRAFDVTLLDLRLPDMNGIEVLEAINHMKITTEVVIITAYGTIDGAISALKSGAADFITKPFDEIRLEATVKNLLARKKLADKIVRYEKACERKNFHRFVGASLEMQAVYRVIESAAKSKATVFVTGASGTGKELCAEAVHKESDRKDKPFVALNCAAIPRDLMESEIFGHVKGAFTGALNRRDGAASRAHRGTLFLDEVCEMDLELQSKLLRFIQTSRFQRIGDSAEEEVDIRIICATNRDPAEEVREKRFREDLFYRLNVIPLELPLLKDRGEDVMLLAEEFLRRIAAEESKEFSGFSEQAIQIIMHHHWPGNVRELENVIRNIVVLNIGEVVHAEMFPKILSADSTPSDRAYAVPHVSEENSISPVLDLCAEDEPAEIRPLWIEEHDAIERAIRTCGDNIAKAAALLEISPSTIYRKRAIWQKNLESGGRSVESRASIVPE